MEPTLVSDNILITERISTRFNAIQRGDIIIAKSPTNPVQHICKRVVGLPGDRIKVKNSFNINPFANSKKLKSDIDRDYVDHDFFDVKQKSGEFIVPRGHVWIEGDNSENSSDSRYYGPIPQGLIQSRAFFRLWPFKDMRFFS